MFLSWLLCSRRIRGRGGGGGGGGGVGQTQCSTALFAMLLCTFLAFLSNASALMLLTEACADLVQTFCANQYH